MTLFKIQLKTHKLRTIMNINLKRTYERAKFTGKIKTKENPE